MPILDIVRQHAMVIKIMVGLRNVYILVIGISKSSVDSFPVVFEG